MPFSPMQDFTFKHSEQVDAIYTQYTAQQIKALFDSQGEELRIAFNLLITALNSTEGASNIGTNTIQDLDGTTIQEMLKSIRDKLKSKVDGVSGADYVHATPIEGLAGESVQAILEALKGLVDSSKSALETSIDSVQASLDTKIDTSIAGVRASNISADPIAVGSGNTVQTQLSWLLSQIAVAATGSIPDGTLTEAKLTQALVDKINKSLSNIGVLTTLSTEDKSSLVNALNEVHGTVETHKAEDAIHLAGGTANTITVNTGGNYSYGQFKQLRFKAVANNTGNVTINVDGKGAVPALKFDGTQLAAGALKANKIYDWYYDESSGGRFFLIAKASGNVVAGDVLAGKTFSNDDGELVGTMQNNGTQTFTPQTYIQTIPTGYHNGTRILAMAGATASGTTTLAVDTLTVTGLSFTPATIMISHDYPGGDKYRRTYSSRGNALINRGSTYTNSGGMALQSSQETNSFTITGSGFTIKLNTNFNVSVYWVASSL